MYIQANLDIANFSSSKIELNKTFGFFKIEQNKIFLLFKM